MRRWAGGCTRARGISEKGHEGLNLARQRACSGQCRQHVGACTTGRPTFSHGARPQPTPSRAARHLSRSPPPRPSRWRARWRPRGG
eukprot:7272418-Prymnesium_polylepis.1